MIESVQNIYEDVGNEMRPSGDKSRIVLIREGETEGLKRFFPREIRSRDTNERSPR
jgi:hypothetical protein